MMLELPGWAAPLSGLLTGAIVGYLVRQSRLCTFGAIEDALIGRDWRRMKIFVIALAIAITASQSFILAGWLNPSSVPYVPTRVPYLSNLLGSMMFGLGMSYIGTCAFGSLVRLGSGDMRSLIAIIIFSFAAYATLRGIFAPIRIGMLEAINIPGPGGRQTSLPDLASYLSNTNTRAVVAIAATLVLLFLALDRRLLRTPRLLAAAVALGAGVAAGWFFTGVAVDPFADPQPKVESLTYVAPTALSLFLAITPDNKIIGFSVANVFGVVAGAFAHALRHREFRWEAFDDQYEMRRHIKGAILMGIGGVLAGGCTIGQGLSAGSMLSYSWLLAVPGMLLGTRIGLSILLEGSVAGWLGSFGSHKKTDP